MADAASAVEASLDAIQSSADARMGAALSGILAPAGSPPVAAPAAQPPPPPPAWATPPTPAVAAPESPSAPVVAAPQAPETSSAPIIVDPSKLSPAALRYLQMNGGDPQKALERGLDANNRLGHRGQNPQNAQNAPEAPPPAPVEPAPVAVQEPPALDAPPLDPAAIRAAIDATEQADPWFRASDAAYVRHKSAEATASAEVQRLQGELQKQTWRLEMPEVSQDSFAVEETRRAIRDLKLDLQGARADWREAATSSREILAEYKARRSAAEAKEIGRRRQAAEEVDHRAELQRGHQEYAQELTSIWPAALASMATHYQIEPTLLEKLGMDANRAHPDFGRLTVQETLAVVEDVARRISSVVESAADRLHREQSARYGAQAHARAGQPGPSPAPQAATSPKFQSLDDIQANADRRFMARARA